MLALRGVDNGLASVDGTGIYAEEGELADVGVSHNLESQGSEGADGWDTWGNEVACDVAINSRPETTGGGLCV